MGSKKLWFYVFCFFKERTQDEIERTKQFSKDVVDLLRHQPHFRMPFNKFIPSYHHHFGRQCKLAYYGFTKLLELFEAIPDTLQVSEEILILWSIFLNNILEIFFHIQDLFSWEVGSYERGWKSKLFQSEKPYYWLISIFR